MHQCYYAGVVARQTMLTGSRCHTRVISLLRPIVKPSAGIKTCCKKNWEIRGELHLYGRKVLFFVKTLRKLLMPAKKFH